MPDRLILATSGGFLPTGRGPYQWRFGPLIRYALALSGKSRPKMCYLGTATGDSANGTLGFYGACAGESVDASHLQLFAMPNVVDVTSHLLSQDVIWVGGGSVANLLAVWRVHRVDEVLREAWERGIVLAGVSAGSICWHVGGTTDSFGLDLQIVTNGLGLVPFSNGVHYDSEAQRRPAFHAAIASSELPAGYATEDGVGVLYRGTEYAGAFSDRPGKQAFFVERRADGTTSEIALPVSVLGQP